MTALARRRLLVVALLVTVAVLLLDLAGSPVPDRARSLAAAAVGPVQRAAAGVEGGDAARLAQENEVLKARLARAETQLDDAAATGRLLTSRSASSGHLLAARVVGSNATATGGHQVTLDVGQRDGVEPNLTVVSGEGLVGRVVTVAPWSCDVRLLDGADAAVAVRVGSGPLGSVSLVTPGDVPPRARGDLTLTLVDPSAVAVGDPVTTLGSLGGRPYVPGVLVGTITAVDPPRGRLAGTAVVHPAVDDTRLDIVAVVLPMAPGAPAAQAAS